MIILPQTRAILTSIGSQANCVPDSFLSSVVNLSHCNIYDTPSNTTINSVGSGLAFVLSPTATISSAHSVFGGKSLRAPANDYANTVADANYGYGTGDFTIEFRLRADSLGTYNIWDQRLNVASHVAPTIYMLGTGVIAYHVNGTDRITSATGVLVANTWLAIAISRVSGTTRMFADGVQVGSNYTDANSYITSQINLFTGVGATAPMQGGYMDEIRITKGVGRYAANYTIATQEFCNSGAVPVTWNPSDKASFCTLSNGNLTANGVNNQNGHVRATRGRNSGKYYFEIVIDSVDGPSVSPSIGLMQLSAAFTSAIGQQVGGWGIKQNRLCYANNVFTETISGTTWVAGDVAMVAIDFTAGKMWVGANGVWWGGGSPTPDPANGNRPFLGASPSGTLYPAVAPSTGSASATQLTGRFTSASFSYTIPSGYSAWDSVP